MNHTPVVHRSDKLPSPEHALSLPVNNTASPAENSLIAGSVLPIQRAEELLGTLPGVISARIVAGPTGSVEEIHILTNTEVTAKQTVRNVESALIAHLGMRVSHKKISVAMSADVQRPQRVVNTPWQGPASASAPGYAPPTAPAEATPSGRDLIPAQAAPTQSFRRRIYFEDVEVRRSRTKGVACRVTLRKGDQSYVGEAEGLENERLRIEL